MVVVMCYASGIDSEISQKMPQNPGLLLCQRMVTKIRILPNWEKILKMKQIYRDFSPDSIPKAFAY